MEVAGDGVRPGGGRLPDKDVALLHVAGFVLGVDGDGVQGAFAVLDVNLLARLDGQLVGLEGQSVLVDFRRAGRDCASARSTPQFLNTCAGTVVTKQLMFGLSETELAAALHF